MYLHSPVLEVGSWWRVDTASGTNTPTTVYAHDGADAIPTALGASGSTVRGNTRDGTGLFWSSAATLYCKELTYQGVPTGTVVTSTGVTPTTTGGAGSGGPVLGGPNVWTGTQDFTGATVTGVGGGAAALLDRGNWATSTVYAVGDVTTQAGQRYACRTAHTAGTFATDLAASKWVALDAVAALAASNNLSDVTAATARANLGLGTAATISSTAGGDLSGTLPSPTVAKVNGVGVSGTPSNGQVITASGSTAASWQTPASGSVPVTSASSGTAYTVTAPTHGESRLKLTLTGNCTFTLSGGTASEVCAVQLHLVQDSGAPRTVTWPGSIDWGVNGAPVLSTAATKTDRIYLTTDDAGASWQGALVGTGYTTPTAPGAPTIGTPTTASGQITVNWTQGAANGSAVTQNKIYRSTTTGTETLVATISAATTYTDTGLTNGTTYYYKVSAVNGVGEGSLSGETSMTCNLTTIATDTFTAADGTTMGSRATETGSKTWSAGGTATIQSNAVTGGTAANSQRINAGVSDCSVQADVTPVVNSGAGVTVRYVDGNNYVAFIYDNSGWFLQKKIGGSNSNVNSQANSQTPGAARTMKLTASGTTFTGYINGVQVVTGTIADAVFTSVTNVGIFYGNTANIYDNFQVTVP